MKILFWRTEFYGAITEGATAILHRSKIDALEKMGHDIVMVSSGPMGIKPSTNFYEIKYNKYFRNLPELHAMFYNYKSTKKIKEIIQHEKPAFIHKYHHDFQIGGAVVKKRHPRVPIILHMDSIQYWVKKNWGTLYNEKIMKQTEEIEVRNADAIIVPSYTLKRNIVDYFNIDHKKVFVAISGFDEDKFYPKESVINNDKINSDKDFIVTYTGTFGQWHGVEFIAKSIKKITEKYKNIKFLFVGDGLLRPKVEEIVKSNNVADNVIFTGMVDFAKIPDYLAISDVLLSPCVSTDESDFFSLPIKVFEYMAMKKPVVVTDLGDLDIIFKDKENALVVEEDNVDQLANAIIELYNNKELREKIAENAYKDSLEKYTWKHNAEIILQAYEYAVKNR